MPRWLEVMHYFLIVSLITLIIVIIGSAVRLSSMGRQLARKDEMLQAEIRERREAEDLLQVAEKKYKILFDASPDAIIILDSKGKIIDSNRAAAQLAGMKWKDGWGKTLGMIGPLRPNMPLIEEKLKKLLAEGGRESFEIDIQPGGGSEVRHVVVTAYTVEKDFGERVVYVIATDITDRFRMEEQIMYMQKMDAVGMLAAGIAHDFNNLLTGILGYSNMLKLNFRDNEDVCRPAEVIEKSAERAARLTSQLLAFARMGKHQVRPVDMHDVIGNVISILDRTIEKSIQIKSQFNAKNPVVSGDPNQLEQVILNLALNARDAMSSGGRIFFVTESVTLDEEYCRDHKGAVPGSYLLISVQDTGPGIPREIKHRVFEPFFTTKKRGEGTGMGLAMVYGIVKNHEGSVFVESEPGQGTRVNLYLPETGRRDGREVRVEEKEPTKGTGRIMVVDDEEMILRLAEDMLPQIGYEVDVFRDSLKAIRHYRENMPEIDLVILDMIMPGIDGGEVFRRLKEIDPGVKAILSSGYILDEQACELLDGGMAGFLQKPFTLPHLADVVAQALAGGEKARGDGDMPMV